ncbi:MAG TPA: ATP-binding protein, partial [Pontibacter sp.]
RELSGMYPAAAAYTGQASGLLALEISRFRKEYILYFKPEIQETRIWAGNPQKSVVPGKLHIHPRKSFDKWSEVVKGKSQPWSVNELEIAQYLQKDVVSVMLRRQADALTNLNKELKKSTNALSAKNKRLEEFAHIISHNLRAPLSNMQGLCNLHKAERSPVTTAEVMEMMQTMIRNMAGTIDDVNLILRSEAEQGLEWQQVNLQEIVEKELQSLQPAILQSNATISTTLQVTDFRAPRVYLESIVHNLLSNALKYRSPAREPIVAVCSWSDSDVLLFQVSDNGLGMDMAKVGGRLFSMYSTFHKNNEAKGLGLYLTKMQVESLGGSITADSEPGKGTTFTVRLPLFT